MKPETSDAIRDMTLAARKLLVDEISEQLEGICGLAPSGKFKPSGDYPVLKSLPEAGRTREALETLLADEKQAGIDGKDARAKLVKEAAFTWLNRVVAFKMLEARKLLRQSVSKGQDSNGFKMWLTEPGNEQHLRDYEAGDLPQDGLGEGPRQRAYRRFLLAQCSRLAEEVRVLFDPDNLASRLCPRPHALRELIGLLNDDKLAEAWAPGNEETIGWVYQFFIEQEKKEVFDRLYKQKKKIRAEDIPAATQIFTPRWIVRCLIENTLGRMWVDMHPDSELASSLEYLVPLEGERPSRLKSVRDITLLDPACGTMHFGLVAFDLFVKMYREELAQAGEPGWTKQPPVESEDQIPAAILAHNLHGIDIDLRAVQLSALTLYLKAKTLNPRAELSESRLACADIHMLDGERLAEFLEKSGLKERPIYGRILAALQQRLHDAEQLGSLLRLEQEIRELVEKERRRYEKADRQMAFPGWSEQQFETEAGRREFWETMELQIGQALDAFAREQADAGRDQSFFAGETTKGLRLLEIMGQRYDIVVTNPPYMTASNMNSTLKGYLQKEYSGAKGDLYAAFIQRSTEWLADEGRLGMVTQQSFMFISSYEKLRAWLRERIAIETMPHVGPRAFEEVTGEKVNTTLVAFRRESDATVREESRGVYFRLVKQPDAESKRRRFEQALANVRSASDDPIVYCYRQADFDAIPGSPWVYWASEGIRELFHTFPQLGGVFPAKEGINTGENARFLRVWWEVGREAGGSGTGWYRIAKGTESKRFISTSRFLVQSDLPQMELLSGSAMRNRDCFFTPGVTFLSNSSSRFCAWATPANHLFCSTGGRSLFPPKDQILTILGLLNSNVCDRLLSLINPTITVKVGDLNRLPLPNLRESAVLQELVRRAMELASEDSEEDESNWDFFGPPPWPNGLDELSRRREEMADIQRQIDKEVYRLYRVSDEDRAAIEAELAEASPTDDDDGSEESAADDESDAEAAEQAWTRPELARAWVSYVVGIGMGRFQPGVENGLGRGKFSTEVAESLRNLADTDGVMVLDEGHPDDLATRVFRAVRLMLGEDAAREVVGEATGRDAEPEVELRRYLSGPFFREHIQKYRKRPVYWLLQSPRKKYGIWLFLERLTADTLYRIRGDQYVGSKLNLLDSQLAELQRNRDAADGRERRRLEKAIAELEELRDDVQAFADKIDSITARGYTPHIDDGVLINMAPLWELVPSWQAEPKKCWQALERGDYDWAHMAMDYWPDRVKEKCKENKSYAIAHGLAE